MLLKLAIAALLVMNVSLYRLGNPCPDGVAMVMCSEPPCALVRDRYCKETFCGGCNAHCYDAYDNPIYCTYIQDHNTGYGHGDMD